MHNPLTPLEIPLRRSFVNTLPVALGWGTTRYGGEEVSRLRGVPLPVWTNKDCDNAYFQVKEMGGQGLRNWTNI